MVPEAEIQALPKAPIWTKPLEVELAQAVDTACWADVVDTLLSARNAAGVGRMPSRSTTAGLRLQLQLAEKIAATGKPVVMLLSSGRPV